VNIGLTIIGIAILDGANATILFVNRFFSDLFFSERAFSKMRGVWTDFTKFAGCILHRKNVPVIFKRAIFGNFRDTISS